MMQGRLLLSVAADAGNMDEVDRLLSRGIDVNARASERHRKSAITDEMQEHIIQAVFSTLLAAIHATSCLWHEAALLAYVSAVIQGITTDHGLHSLKVSRLLGLSLWSCLNPEELVVHVSGLFDIGRVKQPTFLTMCSSAEGNSLVSCSSGGQHTSGAAAAVQGSRCQCPMWNGCKWCLHLCTV